MHELIIMTDVGLIDVLSITKISNRILNLLPLSDLYSLWICCRKVTHNVKLQSCIQKCSYTSEPIRVLLLDHPQAYKPGQSTNNFDDEDRDDSAQEAEAERSQMYKVLPNAKWVSVTLEKCAWTDEEWFKLADTMKPKSQAVQMGGVTRLELDYRTDFFKALIKTHQPLQHFSHHSSGGNHHTSGTANTGMNSNSNSFTSGSTNGHVSLTYEQIVNSEAEYCDPNHGVCLHCDHYRQMSLVNDGRLCHIAYRVMLTYWPSVTHLTLSGDLPANMIRQLVTGYTDLECLIIRSPLIVDDILDTIANYERLTRLELHLYATAADGTRIVQWTKKCTIPALDNFSLYFINESIDKCGLLSVVLGAIVRRWPNMKKLAVTKSPLRRK